MLQVLGVDRLCDYTYRKSLLALNVKVYNYKLSDDVKKSLKTVDDSVLYKAEDRAREDFWDWVADFADETFCEKVYSDGRSGGWLIIPKYTSSYLEQVIYDIERFCAHCEFSYEQHAGGKCLYDVTSFTADYSSGLDLLDKLEYFSGHVKKTLANVGEGVEHFLMEELDNVTLREGVSGV